jgi:hypothetical protein
LSRSQRGSPYSPSPHPWGAPVHALATYFDGSLFVPISPKAITSVLQQAVHAVGPSIGFLPTDVYARSLRAPEAMALLCTHVDTDTIQLLGRWRSDEMLRYLHIQAAPIMARFSRLIYRWPTTDAPCCWYQYSSKTSVLVQVKGASPRHSKYINCAKDNDGHGHVRAAVKVANNHQCSKLKGISSTNVHVRQAR